MCRTFENLAIQWRDAHIDPMYRAWRVAGSDGINQDQTTSSFPLLDQCGHVPLVFLCCNSMFAKQARSDEPRGVIVPKTVAQADDHHGSRTTSSLRKCVAQEIQG